MSSIPIELLAPIDFLKKFKLSYLSHEYILNSEKIAFEFEIVAASPIYKPVAIKILENIAEIIKELSEKKKSNFIFPVTKTELQINEGPPIDLYDENTFKYAMVPDFSMTEKLKPFTDEDKAQLWNEYIKMLNRFKKICNEFGVQFEQQISDIVINKFVLLEINDKPVFQFNSREKLISALKSEIPKDKISDLKIEVQINLGEIAYIFDRLKSSGKFQPLIDLFEEGAFWRGKKLSWQNIKNEKSKFIRSAKKDLIRDAINVKIDELLDLM